MLDIETGREAILHPADSFMFIPLRWWPHLVFAFGIAFLFLPPAELETSEGAGSEMPSGGERRLSDDTME